MTTDVAVRSKELTVLTNEQLQFIAGTEFVPPGLRNNLPAILACVATGRALGIADMTALRSIHVIDGKPSFSAELMVLLARKAGHSITGESTPEQATAIGKRADNGDTMTVTWTMEMAQNATYYVKGGSKKRLADKDNWASYPQSMLWARAVSQLCRMLFPDCFAGATYTPEELEGSAGGPSPDIPGEQPLLADGAASGAEGISGESAPPSPAEQIKQAAQGLEPLAPGEHFDEQDPNVRYITEKQRTRLWTIAEKANVDEDRLRALVVQFTGQESTKRIPIGRVYDGLVAAVQAEGDTE